MIVAPDTTMGLRRANTMLERALESLGISYVSVTPDFRLASRVLHRDMLLIDLMQALELRRATRRALRVYRPRAVIFSTTHAAMLQPDRVWTRSSAIRFDSPAAVSRIGRRFTVEHLLERISFRGATLLLPWGLHVSDAVRSHVENHPRVTAVPIPILDPNGAPPPPDEPRERIVVLYAGSPWKKGLDIAVTAWAMAPRAGWQLYVTGIEAKAGRDYLRARGVREPDGIVWRGPLEAADYRQLSRRAAIFVAASRYEDFGLAQLEALADGCLLVTVPSKGPYAAAAMARVLDSRLVAGAIDDRELGRSLGVALRYSHDAHRAYRERALKLVSEHGWQEMVDRLQRQVLPMLLS
jgi:glycosyltransferase involved in cell wall biosynthesis